MGIMLILRALHSSQQRKLGQQHRTVILPLNFLHNHRRATDLRIQVDREVGAGMAMFHLQYTDKDQSTTTESERYSISSQRWVSGLGREFSNMHTLCLEVLRLR